MLESGVVVDKQGNVIHWHLPQGRSSVYLPDTSELWQILWDNRNQLAGVAHTHPGSGIPGPSYTDLTTFLAIEQGLGRSLEWWISSSDRLILIEMNDRKGLEHSIKEIAEHTSWLDELRWLSSI